VRSDILGVISEIAVYSNSSRSHSLRLQTQSTLICQWTISHWL